MKYIILFLLLTGCESRLDDSQYSCTPDRAKERSEFISVCVRDLKNNMNSCERLSERLFCTKLIQNQSHDTE